MTIRLRTMVCGSHANWSSNSPPRAPFELTSGRLMKLVHSPIVVQWNFVLLVSSSAFVVDSSAISVPCSVRPQFLGPYEMTTTTRLVARLVTPPPLDNRVCTVFNVPLVLKSKEALAYSGVTL